MQRVHNMNVSIGFKLREGPWGGGNQFVRSLVRFLRERGDTVSFDLSDPQLDIILLTDPRAEGQNTAYTDKEIRRYLRSRNPRALVVHRVNECDERKGTTGVNRRLIEANACADHTVFVSSWLRDLFVALGLPCRSRSVILNGSDTSIFNASGYVPWDHRGKLRLVTHHWGANRLKGFDIYERIDGMLTAPAFADRIAFTYVGNVPPGFRFRNAVYQTPLTGAELAARLRVNHVYVTGSQNEPGGHHQNEGAMCGLPLLYRDSASMPEYGAGFGIPFTTDNFEEKLEAMIRDYDQYAARMKDYPHTAEKMCGEYHRLFHDLLSRRESLLAQRPRGGRFVSWLRKMRGLAGRSPQDA